MDSFEALRVPADRVPVVDDHPRARQVTTLSKAAEDRRWIDRRIEIVGGVARAEGRHQAH